MRRLDADIAVIDRAARLRGRSRTDFAREAAVRAAEEVSMEGALVRMSPTGFAAFQPALDLHRPAARPRHLPAARPARDSRRPRRGRALVVKEIGVRAIDDAAGFWRRWGFVPSKDGPLLFRSIADIAASIAGASP